MQEPAPGWLKRPSEADTTDLVMAAVRTYAGQAGRLWAVAAVLSAPSALLGLWIGAAYGGTAAVPPAGYLAAIAAVGLLTAALNVVALGSVTRMADTPGLRVGQALAAGLACFWRLAGVGLLTALLVAVGLICLVIPGIYLAVALSLVTPAVVLGGAGVRAAMRTSYRLAARGTFWRAAETLLLAAIATTVVAWALGVAPAFASVLQVMRGPGGAVPPSLGQQLLAYIGKVLTLPFGTIVAVVLYRDLEARKGAG
jgi:hypothetical protein